MKLRMKKTCSVNYCKKKKKKALVHVQKELCPLVYTVIFLHTYEYTLKYLCLKLHDSLYAIYFK